MHSARFVVPSFDAGTACKVIEKYKVNWVFLSPTMMKQLQESGAVERHDVSTLDTVVLTGAPLYHENLRSITRMLPNTEIFLGYGLTELGGYLCLQSGKSPKGSSGELVDNSELKVVDPFTGRILGPEQRGELNLKSPYMMSSYYKNPEATARVIDSEGWLRSGDFGYYDEDGEVFVIDRLNDLIKCGNGYICPSEIENVILCNRGVGEVAEVGKPRHRGDDFVIVFVVVVESSTEIEKEVLRAELTTLVAEQLPESMRERGGTVVRFIDSIPKLPVGKIRYSALRAMVE